MDEDIIKMMSHEELVKTVYEITHQLDHETQQKLKNKIESEMFAAVS